MSAAPQLDLPKRSQPQAEPPPIVTPAEHERQKREREGALQRQEFAGRDSGKPHGTFVTDEAERQMCILLCSGCTHKFDPAKYHYYLTREFRVQGRCDGCKEHSRGVSFYIYEGLLGRKHGQCWTPK